MKLPLSSAICLVFANLLVMLVPAASAEVAVSATAPRRVLTSSLAGAWYEADPTVLRKSLDHKLAAVRAEPLPDLRALVLPHAGYRFSGATAAHGLHQIGQQRYRRVIVLGPSHHQAMTNAVSFADVDAYQTVLGEIPVDRDALEQLRLCPYISSIAAAHVGEHSVQIELPLLQHVLGNDFNLVALVVGQLQPAVAAKLAQALRPLLDAETLLIVSSDFTHYGPRYKYEPFTTDVATQLRQLDMTALEHLRGKSPTSWDRFLQETGATVCGRHALSILLHLCGPDSSIRLLNYDTSGRLLGDYRNSVSYFSLAVTGAWLKPSPDQALLPEIPAADRQALLRLARQSIAYYLEHGRKPSIEALGFAPSAATEQVLGAFVSLHKHGLLRGCIGEIVPRRALYEAVLDQAVNAAMFDRRFAALRPAELAEVAIEISALLPPHRVGSSANIELGRHGIVLEQGGRNAVYLPQVPLQQNWTRAQTLTQLAHKAGLASDAWQHADARLLVFEAIVFAESHAAK